MRHHLVPATPPLLRAVMNPIPRTVEAFVVMAGARPVGAAGVYLDQNRLVAWSHLTPEIRRDKRVVVEGWRRLITLAADRGLPLHAKPDPGEPGAERLLEHMGFQPGPRGVWICSPPSSRH